MLAIRNDRNINCFDQRSPLLSPVVSSPLQHPLPARTKEIGGLWFISHHPRAAMRDFKAEGTQCGRINHRLKRQCDRLRARERRIRTVMKN